MLQNERGRGTEVEVGELSVMLAGRTRLQTWRTEASEESRSDESSHWIPRQRMVQSAVSCRTHKYTGTSTLTAVPHGLCSTSQDPLDHIWVWLPGCVRRFIKSATTDCVVLVFSFFKCFEWSLHRTTHYTVAQRPLCLFLSCPAPSTVSGIIVFGR